MMNGRLTKDNGSKVLNGEELAMELISVISVSYGIALQNLLAAMKDHASVSEAAIHTLKIVYPNLLSVAYY